VTAVTEPKPMTVAEPGLSRRARRTLVGFLTVYLVLYFATWVGGYRSHAQYLKDRVQASYRFMERERQREEEQALRFGVENEHFTDLYMHKSGPKYGVSWCVPVVPGVLLVYSYESTGPLMAGGGIKIILYDGSCSYELCTLWGWLA
jgi:hypothetical protein